MGPDAGRGVQDTGEIASPRLTRPASAPAVSVRSADERDLDTVVTLRLALLREHADNPVYRRLRPDARERAERLFAVQLASPDEVTFLAHRSGGCVGILRCVHSSGSPLLYPPHYAYVSSVYVLPLARRTGVLRSLLAAAERWCEGRGLTEMRLHNASNHETAGRVWSALGFDVVEHLRVRQLRARD